MSTKLNVLEHVMVPDHKIMSEEEVSTLFSTYKITSEHLPKIYHDEPAVKIIGAKSRRCDSDHQDQPHRRQGRVIPAGSKETQKIKELRF